MVWGNWEDLEDWVVDCVVSGDLVVNGDTGHDNESGLSSRRASREKNCVSAILVITCLVTLSSYAPNVR